MEALRRAVVVLAVGACLAGCGIGLRTGTGVSKTSSPATLQSTIEETPRTADASLSDQLLDLETMLVKSNVRAMFVLGIATGHARYRATMPAGLPIFAKDDNFVFRAGAGLGFAPIHIGPVRPAPYVMYVMNPLTTENTVKHDYELGVNVELERQLDERTTIAIVLGLALTYETGLSYADFHTGDTYRSEYQTTGVLVTLGGQIISQGLAR